MGQLHAAAESPIGAPSEAVYRCIADFREHHPRWLPSAFSHFEIEQGGLGAGTVNRFQVTLGGQTRHFRTHVDEPVPGRVLTETDDEARLVTTFTVIPEASGCRVRIETDWPSAGGIAGLVEGLIAPRLMVDLYKKELGSLDRYARERV